MLTSPTRLITTGAAVTALALGAAAPGALARHGGDDPAGHDRGDDHGRVIHHARGGHDDPAGHDRGDDRGRHGGDDGPGHR